MNSCCKNIKWASSTFYVYLQIFLENGLASFKPSVKHKIWLLDVSNVLCIQFAFNFSDLSIRFYISTARGGVDISFTSFLEAFHVPSCQLLGSIFFSCVCLWASPVTIKYYSLGSGIFLPYICVFIVLNLLCETLVSYYDYASEDLNENFDADIFLI